MNYFTIEELCKSDTAIKKNVDNTPTTEIKENLNILIEFLNPIRKQWGSSILISSGYRSDILNAILGGSLKSAHLIGFAVDMIPKNGKVTDLFNFIKDYLLTNNLEFDELILENNGKSVWVHFALYSIDGKQRKKILQLNL